MALGFPPVRPISLGKAATAGRRRKPAPRPRLHRRTTDAPYRRSPSPQFALPPRRSRQDAPKCELDRPVVFGSLDYDSAQFHAAVAEYIVKHGYGCEIDRSRGHDPADQRRRPRRRRRRHGDLDRQSGRGLGRRREGRQDGARSAPPSRTRSRAGSCRPPSSPGRTRVAPDLKSVADLPKYKELFADPEEPGKGRFYNCPAGWQCEVVNTKKLAAYGLDGDFTNFRPGTGEALDAAAETAALREQAGALLLLGPDLAPRQVSTSPALEEPPFDKATWDAMMAADTPTEATAYPVSKVIIGANKAFTEEAPALDRRSSPPIPRPTPRPRPRSPICASNKASADDAARPLPEDQRGLDEVGSGRGRRAGQGVAQHDVGRRRRRRPRAGRSPRRRDMFPDIGPPIADAANAASTGWSSTTATSSRRSPTRSSSCSSPSSRRSATRRPGSSCSPSASIAFAASRRLLLALAVRRR